MLSSIRHHIALHPKGFVALLFAALFGGTPEPSSYGRRFTDALERDIERRLMSRMQQKFR